MMLSVHPKSDGPVALSFLPVLLPWIAWDAARWTAPPSRKRTATLWAAPVESYRMYRICLVAKIELPVQ